MKLIALGSNLPHPEFGEPLNVVREAVRRLADHQITVIKQSPWYASKPVPVSDQPDFINGVASVDYDGEPRALLDALHAVEASLGRQRSVPNAARIIDLDLLAYNDLIFGAPGEAGLCLPHPRMHERRFVLQPLCDIAPDWVHPTETDMAEILLQRLPPPDEGDTVQLSVSIDE